MGEYCQSNKLQIVGYYQANEVAEDLELGPCGKKISEKIRSQGSCVATLLLDGETMRPTPTDLRLLTFGVDGRRSSVVPSIAQDAEACIKRLEDCLGRGVAAEIVDFD